jgi:hypothetical protein
MSKDNPAKRSGCNGPKTSARFAVICSRPARLPEVLDVTYAV